VLKELLKTHSTVMDDLKNACILIADEQSNEPNSLSSMLREIGCTRVQETLDQNTIIELLRSGQRDPSQYVDMLFLSTTLNTFDVFELCRDLSANNDAFTPIVLITNGSDCWDEHQLNMAYETGAVDFLYRPMRIAECIPRLNLVMRYRQERKSRLLREETLVTELSERKVMETRLNYLLNHDELTSLPSRHRLEAALKIALGKAINLNRQFALLYIDIDNFRLINENLGHERGDRLLKILADILKDKLPPTAMVARVASDEFVIFMDNSDEAIAQATAENVLLSCDQLTCRESGKEMRVRVNIGIQIINATTDIKSASMLLARGDQSCHIAKQRSGSSIFLYHQDDPALKDLQKNRKYVTLLREAIRNDWFELYVQPIVNLSSGETSHYEILIRLNDDTDEMHSPADFIPVAENNCMIDQLDYWVVDKALEHLNKLNARHSDVNFSINLSGDGLHNPATMELIKDKIAYLGLNPSRIMFELTETAAVKDVDTIRSTIARLRSLGCKFAIDDFGSGFSSFNYIKNYPVDYIKIDGMFIKSVLEDKSDQILVKSMVEVAHSLSKKVIAEYVENAAVMDKLRSYGVDYVQGYHLGKPVPIVTLLHP